MSNALWKFLHEVKPIRARYNRLNVEAGSMDGKILNVCCTGWTATAAVNRRAGKQTKQAADELAAIPPPAALEHPYLSSVGSYRTAGFIDSDFAAQLASKQNFAWSAFNSRWTAEEAPVTRFRIALIQYGAMNDLSLPRWVHSIGGK